MTREEKAKQALDQLPSIVPAELADAWAQDSWAFNGEYVLKTAVVPVVAALLAEKDAEIARLRTKVETVTAIATDERRGRLKAEAVVTRVCNYADDLHGDEDSGEMLNALQELLRGEADTP